MSFRLNIEHWLLRLKLRTSRTFTTTSVDAKLVLSQMITFRRSSNKPVLCIIAINRLVYPHTPVIETSYQTRSRIFQLAIYVIRWRGRAYCHVIRYCYYCNNILKALLHNEDGRAWIIPGDVVLNNGSVMVLAGESCWVVHYRVRSTTPSARPFFSQTSWWS